jgi:hypothetical protein
MFGLDDYLKSGSGKSSVRLAMLINVFNSVILTDFIIVGTFFLIYHNKTISEGILIALLGALAVNAGVAGVNKVNQKKHQLNSEKECVNTEKE